MKIKRDYVFWSGMDLPYVGVFCYLSILRLYVKRSAKIMLFSFHCCFFLFRSSNLLSGLGRCFV